MALSVVSALDLVPASWSHFGAQLSASCSEKGRKPRNSRIANVAAAQSSFAHIGIPVAEL